ncbi:hypothetical protein [Kitasatospora cinereorecta]|uniref:Uncharacterized protein n=1 Tax=Kitasatospora cinereorecta TaxID=285560 RepID=A0ABW0V935_9ACTN
MTDWSKLSDAYGSADGVPDLLDRFEADPPGVWSELVDRLCPQLDTAFSASVAALPRLAGIAAAREPAEHWTLFAAGPIVSSARRSAEGVAALQLHSSAIEELARLADGQPVVARRLSYLFGGASCTDCGTDFPVAERVIAQATLVVPPVPPAPAVHGT